MDKVNNKYGEEEMLNDIDVLIKKKVELENERDDLKAQLSGCHNYIEQVHREMERKDREIEWFKKDIDETRFNMMHIIGVHEKVVREHRDEMFEFAIARLSLLKARLNASECSIDVLGTIDKMIYDLKGWQKDGKK